MARRRGGIHLLVLCGLLASHPTEGATPSDAAARPSRSEGAGRDRSSAPTLWAGLGPGGHAVGYRVLGDSSRTIHVWYPSTNGGERLSFGGFLGAERVRVQDFLTQAGIGSPVIDRLMESRLYAVASARSDGRVVPLILVAHGNGQDAVDQVVLCEFLASHGYVVAATPSPMLRTPLEREDQVGEFAAIQASELAHAASRVAAVLPADTTLIGVIGHSFGARAALLLAMGDSAVQALVSLDGGIGTGTAGEAFRQAPSFREDVRLPAVLHFFETLDPFMKPDFTLLESLDTRGLTLQPTRGMRHTHFTTWGFAAAVFPEIARATKATRETGGGVVAVMTRTLVFLDRQLR